MKKSFDKKFFSALVGSLLVAFLFVLASLFADAYQWQMKALVEKDNALGMIAYVFLTVIAVVVAPVSTLPLLPLASKMWGGFMAGALSIAGWTIGAQIAFFLARRFGKPLVKKIISFEKLHGIEGRIPHRHLFWSVVFLRMAVPVDVLSYALGLFSHMNNVPYFFATLIGVAPFAFVFAYAGTLPFLYQMETLGFAFFIAILALAHSTRGKYAGSKKNPVT